MSEIVTYCKNDEIGIFCQIKFDSSERILALRYLMMLMVIVTVLLMDKILTADACLWKTPRPSMMRPCQEKQKKENLLTFWKEIASYFDCNIRTCQRWEVKYYIWS